jgi:putative transposase
VQQLCDTFGVSERRACRVVGQPRSTQRQVPRERPDEKPLVARMLALVARHPRYGYRRIWALLYREGWKVNRKRIYRLWRREGLKVPRKKRKKRRLGQSENGCTRRRALGKDHVWCWDFIHDRTSDGRPLKWLTVEDEYTRECVGLEVARSMTATRVIELLQGFFAERGCPRHIRSDNGPEFIALAIREWLDKAAVEVLYIEPGAPWENGYAESFNARLRDELLEAEDFSSPLEARVLGQAWKGEYNHERPHSALGYRTPAEFAARCPRYDPGKQEQVEGQGLHERLFQT